MIALFSADGTESVVSALSLEEAESFLGGDIIFFSLLSRFRELVGVMLVRDQPYDTWKKEKVGPRLPINTALERRGIHVEGGAVFVPAGLCRRLTRDDGVALHAGATLSGAINRDTDREVDVVALKGLPLGTPAGIVRVDPVLMHVHTLLDGSRAQANDLERDVRKAEQVIRSQQADIAALTEVVGDAQTRVNAHREATSRLSTKLDAARSRIDGADALFLEVLDVVEGLLEAPDAHLTRASELLADVRTWREVGRG